MTVEDTLVSALRVPTELRTIPIRPDVSKSGDHAPYIIYTQFAGARVQSLGGDSGLANPHFQIDVYGEDKATVTALKNIALSAVLAEPALGAAFIDDQSYYEPETKLYRHRQDFSFWFYDE